MPMKSLRKNLPHIGLACLLGACVSGRLELNTTPDAVDVTLVTARGEVRNLGKSPLSVAMEDVFAASSDFAQLRVDKEGYHPQTFVIARTSMPSRHEINLTLQALPVPKEVKQEPPSPPKADLDSCQQLSKEALTELSKGVAAVQAIIQKREFEVAKVRLANLIAEYPYISVLYDLQGNVFFLQKNYPQALNSYERSVELDPENIETTFMVKRLRQQLGRSN
jgi:tetratricopeptide (TPR) repeat protein